MSEEFKNKFELTDLLQEAATTEKEDDDTEPIYIDGDYSACAEYDAFKIKETLKARTRKKIRIREEGKIRILDNPDSQTYREIVNKFRSIWIVTEGYGIIGSDGFIHPHTKIRVFNSLKDVFDTYQNRKGVSKIYAWQMGKNVIYSMLDLFIEQIEKTRHIPRQEAAAQPSAKKYTASRHPPVNLEEIPTTPIS